jgi:hypothetical protein
LTVTGATTTHGINVTLTTEIELQLSNVTIISDTPILVDAASSIRIAFSGLNSIKALDPFSAGIGCASESHIVFSGSGESPVLAVVGGAESAGIGTAPDSTCDVLEFYAGHYIVTGGSLGGAAIGTGIAATPPHASVAGFAALRRITIYDGVFDLSANRSACIGVGLSIGSRVPYASINEINEIQIGGGNFTLTTTGGGAGIGAGAAFEGGSSTIFGIAVAEATIGGSASGGGAFIGAGAAGAGGSSRVGYIWINGPTITRSLGNDSIGVAAIGSGLATESGLSEVYGGIRILAGTFDLETNRGAGIGAGYGEGGTSSVARIEIQGGEIRVRSQYAPGIGTGAACLENGRSIVESMAIENGSIIVSTAFSAAIGAGYGGSLGSARLGVLDISGGQFDCAVLSQGGSAIGGGYATEGVSDCNHITITGGSFDLRATLGACVGSGYAAQEAATEVQTLVIQGGEFVCSAVGGPGIGAGSTLDGGNSTVVNLTINGGGFNVTAVRGAAVGAGPTVGGRTRVEEITILTGNFVLVGVDGAAALGSGESRKLQWNLEKYGVSEVGSITVTGGSFHCTATGAAAIGAGECEFGESSVGSIALLGGSFFAESLSAGAGIGAGHATGGISRVESITIAAAANITARSNQSAGIGSALADSSGASIVGVINILGGIVNAHSAADGAGIGAGPAANGTSSVSTIRIAEASVTATAASRGAGIGSGYAAIGGDLSGSVEELIVNSGFLSLVGDVGLGGPLVKNLLVQSPESSLIRIDCAARAGSCINATQIASPGAWISGVTNTSRWIAAGADVRFSNLSMVGWYTANGTTRDGFGDVLMLHIGEFVGLNGVYRFHIKHSSTDFARDYEFNASEAAGVIIAVPSHGPHMIWLVQADQGDFDLCAGSEKTFNVEPVGETFFPKVHMCPTATTQPANEKAGAGEIVIIVFVAVIILAMIVFTVVRCVKRHKQFEPEDEQLVPEDREENPPEDVVTTTYF